MSQVRILPGLPTTQSPLTDATGGRKGPHSSALFGPWSDTRDRARGQERKRQDGLHIARRDPGLFGDGSIRHCLAPLHPAAPFVRAAQRPHQCRIGTGRTVIEDPGPVTMRQLADLRPWSATPGLLLLPLRAAASALTISTRSVWTITRSMRFRSASSGEASPRAGSSTPYAPAARSPPPARGRSTRPAPSRSAAGPGSHSKSTAARWNISRTVSASASLTTSCRSLTS